MTISIQENNRGYWTRVLKEFCYNVLLIAFFDVLFSFAKVAAAADIIIISIAVLLLLFLFQVINNRAILYSFTIEKENRLVIIEVRRFNKARPEYKIKFEDCSYTWRNHYTRYGSYPAISFFKNGKRIFRQHQASGWPNDRLLKIADALKAEHIPSYN